MKTALALLAALLWQIAGASATDPVAAPRHLRYERAVNLPRHSEVASGQACAVLDAAVFAHAATESLNDLRLFTNSPGKAAVETPFLLTESETQRDEDQPAQVRNGGIHGGNLVFDLVMPSRPYTAVVLDLAAKDFIAMAQVFGLDGRGGKPANLGSFALFDLSAQHLSRSTILSLQEETFPELHIVLHLTSALGSSQRDFGPSIVQGASVPPSREAQTLYTTAAETTAFTQRGRETVAAIRIPAHVPIERVSFTLRPKFDKSSRNFLRAVNIMATPDAAQDSALSETVGGSISRVRLGYNGDSKAAGQIAIDNRNLSVDAVLGADLRAGATVEIVVENAEAAPLPLASVKLEMRQRRVCFDAASGASYVLMYGDAALHPPVYDAARLFAASAPPVAATLGPEQRNPGFVARLDARPYSERHPEVLWIGLLAIVAILGSIVLRSSRRQSRNGASKH